MRASIHDADLTIAANQPYSSPRGVGRIVEGQFLPSRGAEAIEIDIAAAAQAGVDTAAIAKAGGMGGVVVWFLGIAGHTVLVRHQQLILVGGRREIRLRDTNRVTATGV